MRNNVVILLELTKPSLSLAGLSAWAPPSSDDEGQFTEEAAWKLLDVIHGTLKLAIA